MAGPIPDGDATRALAAAPLPHSREVAVDASGRLSRPFYTWAASIDRNAMVLSRLADGIKAVLDTLPDALGSTDGTFDGIPPPSSSLALRGQGGVTVLPISDGYLISLAAALADLSDVEADEPAEGDALVFSDGVWRPGPAASNAGGLLPMVTGVVPPQLMYFDDGSLLYAQVE